jgi:site-specific recombinase XerD
MSEKPINPLRQRMLEDMSVRRFTADTQRDYIRAVKKLAAFLGRSPDTATAEELRAFQLHLTETGVQPPTIIARITVLRFFFKVTLDRPETTRHLVFVYEPRKLPRVLSPEEVLRLLEAAPGPKHKAAGPIVGLIDRFSFWRSVAVGIVGLVYITGSRIPQAFIPTYRNQVTGTEWCTAFLVPIVSMATEIACDGILVFQIRSAAR